MGRLVEDAIALDLKQCMTTTALGTLGETFVANWLQAHHWTLLAHQWHGRGGELDLVAYRTIPDQQQFTGIAFVEVKTRTRSHWDANGLLAVTPQKQAKLWQTAQLYLSTHTHLAHLACRFDVALVQARRVADPSPSPAYTLSLQAYLENAFSC